MNKTKFFLSNLLFCVLMQGYLTANAWNVNTARNANGDTASVFQVYNNITSEFDIAVVGITNAGVKSPTTVLGNSATMDNNPLVAINNSGNIIVVWTAVDYTLGLNVLYINYYDGVSWQISSVQISDNDENVSSNYNLEFTDADWVVITWGSFSYTTFENQIRAVYGTLGSLSAPDTLG